MRFEVMNKMRSMPGLSARREDLSRKGWWPTIDDANFAAMPKIMFFITEDWAFLLLWRRLAEACRDAGWQVVIATHVNESAEAILAAGFALEPLPLERRGMNPWREVKTIRALADAVRRQQPDILQCVAIKPILYGAIAARFGRACPVLGTLSGMGYAFTGDRWSVRLLRVFLTAALRVVFHAARVELVVQNRDDLAVVADLGLAGAGRARLIPGGVGVDLDALPVCPPPAAPPVTFTYLGRMLWDKGLGEAVAAARLLKQRGTVCRLVLAGVPDPQNPTSIPEERLRACTRKASLNGWDSVGTSPNSGGPPMWRCCLPTAKACPRL